MTLNTYTPYPLKRLRVKYFHKNKIKKYKGFESKYPKGLNQELIQRAIEEQRRGYYLDENQELVIQKLTERRVEDLKRQVEQGKIKDQKIKDQILDLYSETFNVKINNKKEEKMTIYHVKGKGYKIVGVKGYFKTREDAEKRL